ncbi:MAG: DNA polymerase III subunit gamma/tau [Desulfovibrionaceae bacterium]
MSISSLTAKYRPLTFAEVAGQEAIKTILSRAAATDKVAPAYLFSGTRGVGKTTIARIFAKALNCVEAPTAEPCNKCHRCRQATAGVFPDVLEIDGASHNKVDDARSLKEDVGYAPLEGRYKVIIIDEAHMLTVQAFNALLKTLEEPPARVTFIMATTEVRKFPATIISRCQHYVFQMLSQTELSAHLAGILDKEGVEYEPGALDIVAKRGAGSVRDSMSLLGQALALGHGGLREQDVRAFLGLAGQDVFFSLMQGIQARDLVAVEHVLRGVLDQGLDLGFFLRELAGCWRNMFLLRQAGEAALDLLNLSTDDARAWLNWAGRFDPAQIHASWQMTLEGQRRVMTSLEPALALELLLLNLASLPDLLDIQSVGATRPASVRSGPAGQSGPGPAPRSGGPGMGGPPPSVGSAGNRFAAPRPVSVANHAAAPASSRPAPHQESEQSAAAPKAAEVWTSPQDEPPPVQDEDGLFEGEADNDFAHDQVQEQLQPVGPRNYARFKEFISTRNGQSGFSVTNLRGVHGEFAAGRLVLTCPNSFVDQRLRQGPSGSAFLKLLREFFGPEAALSVKVEDGLAAMTEQQRRKEVEGNPAVQRVMSTFQATIKDVLPRDRA